MACSQLRWLRVAQREHYLTGSATRFAFRWWSSSLVNFVIFLLTLLLVLATFSLSASSVGVSLLMVIAPLGLSLRGRTSKLVWTRRLRLLAITTALLWVLPVIFVTAVTSSDTGVRSATLLLVLAPLLVDFSLWLTAPIERRLSDRFVIEARRRLQRVQPLVVAITGSYGKTTTKHYVAHLLSLHHVALASPRSFNNRAGLARTVNELLVPGTEIFIAEMGTYGPGEIRELCQWIPPRISVITAIGPVHLERFKDLSVTLAAKAEIAEHANDVVLNGDDELLRRLVSPLREQGKRILVVSATDEHADLCLRSEGAEIVLYRHGRQLARERLAEELRPPALTNAACAIGVAVLLGDDPVESFQEIRRLDQPQNRLTETTGSTGVTIIDDTFNSNPAGAELAVERLGLLGQRKQRRVLVTPGMIELGRRQRQANRKLAKQASAVCTDILIVGRTNRRALLAGATGRVHLVLAQHRDEAVAWVKSNLTDQDIVLYENDLPDHYA